MLDDYIIDGQEFAEDRMIDEVDIYHYDGITYDSGTQTDVKAYTFAFRTTCKFARLAQFTPDVQTEEAGEATFVTSKSSLHVPVGAPRTSVDDKAICVTANGDPALLGREFRITGPADKTYATARRLPIEEIANG